MLVGLTILCWGISKMLTNTEEHQDEDEEAEGLKRGVKHQGYQTLDWTEPWD